MPIYNEEHNQDETNIIQSHGNKHIMKLNGVSDWDPEIKAIEILSWDALNYPSRIESFKRISRIECKVLLKFSIHSISISICRLCKVQRNNHLTHCLPVKA